MHCFLVTYQFTFFEDYLYSRKSLILAKEKLLKLLTAKPVAVPAAKGVIAIILLQELIKKECKRPNLFQGDVKRTWTTLRISPTAIKKI